MAGSAEGSLTLTATDLSAGPVTLAITDNDGDHLHAVQSRGHELGRGQLLHADRDGQLGGEGGHDGDAQAAASSASPDDYSVGNITIATGEAEGTTMLVVTEDELPDGGQGAPTWARSWCSTGRSGR